MLRAHRCGDEGDLGWEDHLKDHVNEAASKREGQPQEKRRNSIIRVIELYIYTFDLYNSRYFTDF